MSGHDSKFVRCAAALFLVGIIVSAMVPVSIAWSPTSLLSIADIPDKADTSVLAGGKYRVTGTTDGSGPITVIVVSPELKVSLYPLIPKGGAYSKDVNVPADAVEGHYYVIVMDPGKDKDLSIDLQKYTTAAASRNIDRIKERILEDKDILLTSATDDSYSLSIFDVVKEIKVEGDVDVTADKLEVNRSNNELKIFLPALGVESTTGGEDTSLGIRYEGNQIKMAISKGAGHRIGELVITTDRAAALRGKVQAKIQDIRLKTDDIKADISGVKPDVGDVQAKIECELDDIPSGASLSVEIVPIISDAVRRSIEDKAKDVGLDVKDIAYGLEVQKTNMNTKNAKIRLMVSSEWAEKYGTDNIRIFRYPTDGSESEMISTTYAGLSSDGLMIFEGDSPNGFSVFALSAVEDTASATPTAARGTPGFEAFTAVVGVLGACLVIFLRRRT